LKTASISLQIWTARFTMSVTSAPLTELALTVLSV
jgi:hypothetical protein